MQPRSEKLKTRCDTIEKMINALNANRGVDRQIKLELGFVRFCIGFEGLVEIVKVIYELTARENLFVDTKIGHDLNEFRLCF